MSVVGLSSLHYFSSGYRDVWKTFFVFLVISCEGRKFIYFWLSYSDHLDTDIQVDGWCDINLLCNTVNWYILCRSSRASVLPRLASFAGLFSAAVTKRIVVLTWRATELTVYHITTLYISAVSTVYFIIDYHVYSCISGQFWAEFWR